MAGLVNTTKNIAAKFSCLRKRIRDWTPDLTQFEPKNVNVGYILFCFNSQDLKNRFWFVVINFFSYLCISRNLKPTEKVKKNSTTDIPICLPIFNTNILPHLLSKIFAWMSLCIFVCAKYMHMCVRTIWK